MKNRDTPLRDFYYGRLIPHEHKVNYGKTIYALVQNLGLEEREFLSKLDETQRRQYEKLQKMQTEIHSWSEEETFIYAFSLGVRMTAEALLHGAEEC